VARGEVDGMCALSVSAIRTQVQPMIDSGEMKLIIQMGPHKEASFGDIPSVFDYAKTNEQRQILSLAFDQLALGRPFMAPPGIPEDRYEALSKAFAATLKDPALLADAAKAKLDIDYVSGEDAKKLLKQFADTPPAVLQKAKLALGQE
jgi:tripartite-type tricarboxylate transporter receptor subunit TctC